MKKQHIIFWVIAAVVVIGGLIWFGNNGSDDSGTDGDKVKEMTLGDPTDIVSDFYKEWLEAVKDEARDPYDSDLVKAAVLGQAVKDRMNDKLDTSYGIELDSVLCQEFVPERIGVKAVFVGDTKAEVMVLARGGETKSPNRAIVTLDAEDGEWKITKISCASGESAPEREFTFERDGYLLKSVPAPLNSDNWHLVFEENGEEGHTVPLFFDFESTCIASDGGESVCAVNALVEPTKAFVQGQMTEAGLSVKRITFSE